MNAAFTSKYHHDAERNVWFPTGTSERFGYSDGDLMGNRRELRASLRLTRWLRCRFHIRVRDVIGHAESLSSPYHRERVRRLRTQTHGDMRHATMVRYRRALGSSCR